MRLPLKERKQELKEEDRVLITPFLVHIDGQATDKNKMLYVTAGHNWKLLVNIACATQSRMLSLPSSFLEVMRHQKHLILKVMGNLEEIVDRS